MWRVVSTNEEAPFLFLRGWTCKPSSVTTTYKFFLLNMWIQMIHALHDYKNKEQHVPPPNVHLEWVIVSFTHHLNGVMYGPCKSGRCCPSHARHLMIKMLYASYGFSCTQFPWFVWILPPNLAGLSLDVVWLIDTKNQLIALHPVLAMKVQCNITKRCTVLAFSMHTMPLGLKRKYPHA